MSQERLALVNNDPILEAAEKRRYGVEASKM